jgi:hypothetical protein
MTNRISVKDTFFNRCPNCGKGLGYFPIRIVTTMSIELTRRLPMGDYEAFSFLLPNGKTYIKLIRR